MTTRASAKDFLSLLSLFTAVFLAAAAALPLPAVADPLDSPVDAQQMSEPLRNSIYEKLYPLIDKKDRATQRQPETPAPPEGSETPEKTFQLKDLPSKQASKETEGGCVPSKGHPMSDGGQILPDGRYAWCGPDIGCLTGVVPNPSYGQCPADPPAKVKDVGNGPMMDKLREAMNGLPITNSQFAILSAMAPQAAVDQLMDPKGWRQAMKQVQQTQQSQGADQQAECAESNGDCAFSSMKETLINVANEGAATPTSSQAPFKTYSQVVWMVQKMYRDCYLPMALLFLLPGAILTQVKGLVSFGILGAQDEDSSSPIAGIVRAMIAIFLIPATQLIVSYVIDIGNSLTYTVKDHIDEAVIQTWAHEQTFNTSPQNAENFIANIPNSDTPMPFRGKLASALEQSTIFERQSFTTSTMQYVFNTLNAIISQGLVILNGFQVVLMCYLFLLGPLAAAFFAWPSGIGRDLFRRTFSNWMDGVVVLALWKFWWCIVLLCMSVRLSVGGPNPGDQFEMFIYTAFMGLLLFVPFQPFDFKPGEIVSQVLEKAAAQGGGGSGGGGGSSGGGGSGSCSGGASGGGSATNTGGKASAISGSAPGSELNLASDMTHGPSPSPASEEASGRPLEMARGDDSLDNRSPDMPEPPSAVRKTRSSLAVALNDIQIPPGSHRDKS